MVPDADARSQRYGELKMPVVIVAGEQDRIVDIDAQSGRLNAEVPQSVFHRVAGAGHMLHQTATDVVMAAIDEAAGRMTNDSCESARGPNADQRGVNVASD